MAIAEDRSKQGVHVDPLGPGYAPPNPAELPAGWRESLASREMAVYREALLMPGASDVRAGVIDDLSTYYQLSPEETVRRCLNWEAWSVSEWRDGDRSTASGLRDFYNSVQSWCFDLLWYAYIQAAGSAYPTAVAASRTLQPPTRAPRCLDFGSGVGDLAMLLQKLGYTVDLADVSKTLLAFARWRFERRGLQAGYIDLNDATIAPNTYDAILAKDVLAHVPDYTETVTMLHRAIKPGGLLITNFDTRPPSPENAWHLYADDLPLRHELQNIGFEQIQAVDGYLIVYRRVEPVGVAHAVRRVRNLFMFGLPRRVYRRAKELARTVRR